MTYPSACNPSTTKAICLVFQARGLAPQADGLDDHLSKVRTRLRDRRMTAHFGRVCDPLSRYAWVRIGERVREISRSGDSAQFDSTWFGRGRKSKGAWSPGRTLRPGL